MLGFGCKLRVLFPLLFGVLKLLFEDICSIVVIRFLNLFPCELDRVCVDKAILSELVCFFGLTVKVMLRYQYE